MRILAASLGFLTFSLPAIALPTKQICKSSEGKFSICIEDPTVRDEAYLTVDGNLHILIETGDAYNYANSEFQFNLNSLKLKALSNGQEYQLICNYAVPGFCRH